MGELTGYFNSLFVIQVTVFGIAFAGLIALTQILRPLLAFKSTQRLITSPAFISTTLLLVISLVCTALATLLLSLEQHNLLWFNAHSEAILNSEWFAVINLLLVLATFIGLVIVVVGETRYLIPSNALGFLRSQTKLNEVRSYFEDTYAQKPFPPVQIRFFGSATSNPDERSDEEIEAEYDKSMADFNKRKARVANKENPMLPLESYLMQSVRRDDIQAVRAALESIENVIEEAMDDKRRGYLPHLINYYSVMISNCIELSNAHGLQSVVLEAIDSTDRIATKLLARKQIIEISSLIDQWQTTADLVIGVQPNVFKRIMSTIRSAGEGMINLESLDDKSIAVPLDNLDRCMGWIGERMLSKAEPETTMIMNMDYETEFDSLMNAVLGIGYALERTRPNFYPLIHFDCLYVIAAKLAPYAKDEERDSDNRNTMFSIMHGIKTFAERAIDVKNIPGAGLALLRLKEQLDIAMKNGLHEQTKHCLEAIMNVGAYAAGQKFKGAPQFLRSKTLADEAVRILSEKAGNVDLSSEATEIIIKAPPKSNHDEIDAYLLKLGDNLGTNFGLNLKRPD